MKIRLDGESLYIRTQYDEKSDLVQKLIGMYADGTDEWGNIANEPIDFRFSGLIPKEQEDFSEVGILFCEGYDETPPFKYNDSYIGANHGQSDGVLITSASHGKTCEDIGSLWKDSEGTKWNLLRIEDENTLLFLSENIGKSTEKYRFKKEIPGKTLICYDKEYAQNTDDIVIEETKTLVQVYPSVKKLDFTLEISSNGEVGKITDGETKGCDSVEISEHYLIMNPSLIGDTLRKNRPAGGYKEIQDLAVGEPVIDYKMKHIITDDGTVLSEFDAVFLCDVDFEMYSGVMHQLRADTFSGGVWRYIPKIKSFDMEFEENTLTYDYKHGYNVTEALKNKNYIASSSRYITKDLWENPDSTPNRAVDYMKDENGNVKAGFAVGYLPVLGGKTEERLKLTDEAVFLYKSGKGYPIFANSLISEESGMKNIRLRGVTYKKYVDYLADGISVYAIPFDNSKYIYADLHKKGEYEIDMRGLCGKRNDIEEIEKSENVFYSVLNGKGYFNMQNEKNGFVVLKMM